VKHLLIILSFLLFSSFLTSCEKKEGILYLRETSSGLEWSRVGDKDNQTQYSGQVKKKFILFGEEFPNGQGTLIFGKGKSEGDKYVGEIKDDKKNGQGTYFYYNGDKYVGEWKDNEPNGQGTFTKSNGNKYVGEYKDGKSVLLQMELENSIA
jgi:hypothetical protein